MKNWLITLMICSYCIGLSQESTKVDSAQKKIEKYYNTKISQEQRIDYKKKISDLNKFINYDSTKAGAFLNRGVYYSCLGLFVNAIDDYNKAIELEEEMPIAYYNRAIAKSRFIYTQDACIDFKRAYELGLDNAKEVYDVSCVLHHRSINAKETVSKN